MVSPSARQKTRLLYAFLLILLGVSGTYYAWLGYYQTYYGLGIFLIPMGLLGGMIIAGFLFVLYWKILKEELKRSLDLSAQIALMAVDVFFVFLIAQHKIERYKPTFFVHVPDNFTGCIYLFPTITDDKNAYLDSLGIGYVPYTDQMNLVLLRNEVNITKALQTGNMEELHFYREDSTIMEVYSVQCAMLNEKGDYPDFDSHTTDFYHCMDERELQKMISWGQVDRSKLVHRFWRRSGVSKQGLTEWDFMGTFVGDSLID